MLPDFIAQSSLDLQSYAVRNYQAGLQADFFNNKTLSGSSVLTRIDPTVEFDWQQSTPNPRVSESFSARWSGKIQPKQSETYTFTTESDDGVRLWVNNQLLIDHWDAHPVKRDQAVISLQANQQYDIRLEYFNEAGVATVKLGWESTSQAAQIIPPTQLSTIEQSMMQARAQGSGRIYYVSGAGSDENNGESPETAFRTLQKAGDRIATGDTIYVMNGTYSTNSDREVLLIYEKNGSPNQWTTIKAFPGHRPKIESRSRYAINVQGSSYVRIAGLELEGNNKNTSLEYALSQRGNLNNTSVNNNGIAIYPSGESNGNYKFNPHHIEIRDNRIHGFGGGGIGVNRGDYITIENNKVYNNGLYTSNGASGISVIYNWNSDDNTNDYKMIIRGNEVYDNNSFVPWWEAGQVTEGNGIILDDGKNTQERSSKLPYRGRTLVDNNLVYNNGAAGIQVFSSENVDVINNTTYQNSQNPDTHYGEIVASFSDRVTVLNNIMVPQPGKKVNTIFQSKRDIRFENNLIYNSDNYTGLGQGNIFGKDPQFVDPAKRDFRLRSNSPAIDAGAVRPEVQVDFMQRPRAGIQDIGAIEFSP
ncbi:MAG: PA14 domain-containing protein [Leptolyngbya sp. Prado105]|jgi:parallel beta-helix repeat protein|nr:PA14 domain-containing protein [Leptolyngbya sp. Prado105]